MILVTGATGFVGHKLMEMCRDTVACPSLRGATEEDVRRIVEECGADTIVHTAAISDMGMCEADPEASYHANVQIPIFLARAAKQKKLFTVGQKLQLRALLIYGGVRPLIRKVYYRIFKRVKTQ